MVAQYLINQIIEGKNPNQIITNLMEGKALKITPEMNRIAGEIANAIVHTVKDLNLEKRTIMKSRKMFRGKQ